MTSSEPDGADRTGRVDVESLADNASAARALEGLRETAASEDRPQPPIVTPSQAWMPRL